MDSASSARSSPSGRRPFTSIWDTTSSGYRATRFCGEPRASRPRRGRGTIARTTEEDATGFYTSGVLKPSPIKELVNKFGEAVISIETPSGKGSGFLINKDGYAITNDHVIQGESRVSVILYVNVPGGFSRRRIEDVEIIALNPFVDLALLKASASA